MKTHDVATELGDPGAVAFEERCEERRLNVRRLGFSDFMAVSRSSRSSCCSAERCGSEYWQAPIPVFRRLLGRVGSPFMDRLAQSRGLPSYAALSVPLVDMPDPLPGVSSFLARETTPVGTQRPLPPRSTSSSSIRWC